MLKLARIVAAEYLGDFRIRLTFSDGFVRELDFDGVLETGVYAPLRDVEFFALVFVDPVSGTIGWPNGVDLDPDVLHGDAAPSSGRCPKVLREYHRRAIS